MSSSASVADHWRKGRTVPSVSTAGENGIRSRRRTMSMSTRVLVRAAATLYGLHASLDPVMRAGVHARRRSAMAMQEETLLFARYKMGMATVHKTAYWGQVALGDPSQPGLQQYFNVIFDTGSGNMILPSSLCHGPGCDRHRKYELTDPAGQALAATGQQTQLPSPSLLEQGQRQQRPSTQYVTNGLGQTEAQISFGTGDIEGRFVRDQLCVGKICTPVNFIASVSQSAEPFEATPFDGILGLGFRDLSMGDGFNIMEDIHSVVPNGMISFALTDNGPSSLTFGGYRKELCGSPMVWAPVTYPSYWQIRVGDITLNNRRTALCPAEGCQVAVDTGTSMLAGPTALIQELSRRVNVASDCSNYDQLPNIGFQIGDKVLNLRPEEYVDNDKGEFCTMSIMTLDVPPPKGPLFIFGDPFLRRFVTAFDKKRMRVGFAVAKGSGSANAISALLTDRDSGFGEASAAAAGEGVALAVGAGESWRAGGAAGSRDPVEVVPLSAGMMRTQPADTPAPPTMWVDTTDADERSPGFSTAALEQRFYRDERDFDRAMALTQRSARAFTMEERRLSRKKTPRPPTALDTRSFLERGSTTTSSRHLRRNAAPVAGASFMELDTGMEDDFSDADLVTIELHKIKEPVV